MKKIFLLIIFILVASGLALWNPAKKSADATSWGNTCPAPNNFCPSGASLNICVSGFTFNTTVNYVNVPAGTTYQIDVYPANADGSTRGSGLGTCGGTVNCLVRNENFSVTVGAGKSSDTFGFDRIGCTTNTACAPNQTDNYAVNAYLTSGVPAGTTCTIKSNDANGLPGLSFEDIYNRNGGSSTEVFTINCTSAPTCPAVPTVVPTITCPNCQ